MWVDFGAHREDAVDCIASMIELYVRMESPSNLSLKEVYISSSLATNFEHCVLLDRSMSVGRLGGLCVFCRLYLGWRCGWWSGGRVSAKSPMAMWWSDVESRRGATACHAPVCCKMSVRRCSMWIGL